MDFAEPTRDKSLQEEGSILAPKFDDKGLITVVTSDARDGAVLMLAHMNADALALTIETGIAHYWSRSRESIWKKGETSGNLQTVEEILVDCDQDAILLRVTVAGHDATCHTGRRSCFFRAVERSDSGEVSLKIKSSPLFEPDEVYKR